MPQELAERNGLSNLRLMVQQLEIEATIQDGDSIDAALDIMENILSATTEEELFEAQEAGTLSGKNYTNIPFRLRADGIEWKKSGPGFVGEGGFPYYCLLRISDMESTKTQVLTCGGKTFVATVRKLQQLQAFDRFDAEGGRPMQLVGKTVSSGFDVLLLKPLSAQPEAARRGAKK